MKKVLISLIALALFQGSLAFAKNDDEKNNDPKIKASKPVDKVKPASSNNKPLKVNNSNKVQKGVNHNLGTTNGNGKVHGNTDNGTGNNGVNNGVGNQGKNSHIKTNNNVNNGVNTGVDNRGNNGNHNGNNGVNNGVNNRGNNGRTALQGDKNPVHNYKYDKNGERPADNHLQKLGIKRVPKPIEDRHQILVADKRHSEVHMPVTGPGGHEFHAKVIDNHHMNTVVVRDHMKIINNNSFVLEVNNHEGSEREANHYYWHNYGGSNYCHYYDNNGYHWYGWTVGSSFFWTRYYGNRWWWYDSAFDRWCYWNDGGWWWQDPVHVDVVFAFNNGNYVSTEDTTAQAQPQSDTQQPAAGGPEKIYQSNSGDRMVKVEGESMDAFLYDTSDQPAFNPIYLSSDVKRVQFSYNGDNSLHQILIVGSDGTFKMFDPNGNPLTGN